MLTKIKKVISDAFLGEAIAETEDIHHSANGKLRIRLGLFRKKDTETVWLDFIYKTFMGRSSVGLGITVDSFHSFSDFLGEAVRKGENKEGGSLPNSFPYSDDSHYVRGRFSTHITWRISSRRGPEIGDADLFLHK